MKSPTSKLLLMLALLALGAVAAGCSDDDDPTKPTADLGEGAMLRVVHASPDAPAVDIYAEGIASPLVTDVSYLETTPYLELVPGTYNIQLRAAGAPASSAPAFETGDLTIPADVTITAVALGLLASSDEADRFRVVPFVEDFTLPGGGQAAVRIVHGSPDAPAVAVDLGNDGSPEVTDFARFGETGAAGVALPAGTALNVGIWAGSPLSRVTAFTTPALAGETYFLIATGLLGAKPNATDGFGLLAVGPNGTVGLIRQDPVVYVLHGSPDAPAVDVNVGGSDTALVDALSFGELSPPVQVPPAAYTLDVRVSAGGQLAATVTTPELMAGERYLAVASGFAGGSTPGLALLPYRDEFGVPGPALVRVVHASPDAPAVDVGVWDGTTFTALDPFRNLAFGDASAGTGTPIALSSVTVGVAAKDTSTPVATFDLALSSDLSAFAVAMGSLAGTGEPLRLSVVVTSTWPWQVAEVLPNE
ncbi:MAG: DUF4397 domain-containing protein [Candidatus Krumholzibacteriia bacterium]